MSVCQSCGGIIGRDCFNPVECAEITAQQAMQSQQFQAENAELKRKIALHEIQVYHQNEENEQLQAKNKQLRVALEQWIESIKEAGEFYRGVFPDEINDAEQALKGGEK